MKTLMILLVLTIPAGAAIAAVSKPEQQEEVAVPMDLDATSTFNNDVESVSEKIRRLMFESRREARIRAINSAQRDPVAAEKALEAIEQSEPELKKQQPQAFSLFHGNITFWKRDFAGAYKNFDEAIWFLNQNFPNGFPADKNYEKNASFVTEVYMGRGSAAMFLGKDKEAVKDFDVALKTSPKPYAYMYMNKCRALVHLKEYKEAAEALDSAQGLDANWIAGKEDKPAICDILSQNGLQPLACQANS